jgi:chromosome segregation ATPase
MRWILLILVGLAVESAIGAEEDWRVQRLNDRYNDFFQRRREEQAYDDHRQAAANEVKKERQQWDKEMAQAREEFIRSKPPPPNLEGAYKEWAAEKAKQEAEYKAARTEYTEIKNRVEKLEQTAKHIPGDVEYDLNNVE